MRHIVYLLYGDARAYHYELTYSVLSARQQMGGGGTGIALYADAENQRPDLPVENILVDNAELLRWQLEGRYPYAAKVSCLGAALERFGGKVMFCDTDTILRAPPEALFARVGPGQALMHADEGPLIDSLEREPWEWLLARAPADLHGYALSMQSRMCNSGVIGLDHADRILVEDIGELMAGLRDHGEIFTTEQFAVATVLAKHTSLNFAADLVTHYWNGPRRYYLYQMQQMFPDFTADAIGQMAKDLPALRDTPPKRLLDVIAARIKRLQRGGDAAYAFAYLAARSALARSTKAGLADVWAGIALDVLIYGLDRPAPDVARDFASFGPESLHDHAWMTPQTRARWQAYWDAAARP